MISPRAHLERDAVERLEIAVVRRRRPQASASDELLAQVGVDDPAVAGDLARACPRRSSRRGAARRCAGPARIIAAMMCSITISVSPSAWSRADEVDHPGQLGRVEPGHHLVEQQQPRLGWPARGRPPAACAGQRQRPGPARRACGPRPQRSITRRRVRPRLPTSWRTRVSAPIITLSSTERLPNGLHDLEGAGEPQRGDRVRRAGR